MAKNKKNLEEIGKDRRIKMLKKILPLCKKNKMVDIGCKFGHSSNFFNEKGFDIEGVDINKQHIVKAKENYKKIDFYVKDVCKGLERKYDSILLIGVLEEISLPPLKVLEIVKKSLNPNGRIIIQVRNTNSLKRRIRSVFGLEPLDPFSSRLWVFTKKRLANVIDKAGYRVIRITYNNAQSLKQSDIPVPGILSEEIWAIIEQKK